MKTTQEYDIKRVFSETKDALNKNMTKSEGRIDMLTELEQFFEQNNLKVVQEVDVPEEDAEKEKAKR